MSKWPMVPLGEIVSQDTKSTLVSADREYPNLGIYSFGRGLFEKPPIPGTTTSAKHLYRVKAGQFIYSRLFAFEGAYGLVSNDLAGRYVSNEYPHFDCNPDRVLPEFLATYFRASSTWEKAATLTTGMGDRRRRIKPEQLITMEIPLPPLSGQKKIVEWVDAVATRVEEASSETDSAVNRLDNLLMSAFREIAEGVSLRPLAEIAPLTRRPAEIDPAAEYPGISARSFGRGTFHNPPLLGSEITWQRPYEVKAGDVLVSNIKAWEGAIAVVSPQDDGRFGSHRYLTFAPKAGVATPRYVCFYLLSPAGLFHVGEASPGSADRNRTTGSRSMQNVPVPVPPYEKQLWFDQLYEKVEEAKRLIDQTRKERAALLPSVLNQVFNGAEAAI